MFVPQGILKIDLPMSYFASHLCQMACAISTCMITHTYFMEKLLFSDKFLICLLVWSNAQHLYYSIKSVIGSDHSLYLNPQMSTIAVAVLLISLANYVLAVRLPCKPMSPVESNCNSLFVYIYANRKKLFSAFRYPFVYILVIILN